MPTGTKDEPTFREYVAWDAPTRWFHWINALVILGNRSPISLGSAFSYRQLC